MQNHPTMLKAPLRIKWGNREISDLSTLKHSALVEMLTQLVTDRKSIELQLKESRYREEIDPSFRPESKWKHEAEKAYSLKGVHIHAVKAELSYRNVISQEKLAETSVQFVKTAKEWLSPQTYANLMTEAERRSQELKQPKLKAKQSKNPQAATLEDSG